MCSVAYADECMWMLGPIALSYKARVPGDALLNFYVLALPIWRKRSVAHAGECMCWMLGA